MIALAGVVTGHLFVVDQWGLAPSAGAGILVGVAAGLVTSVLVVIVKLPPFIATLGVMGITRGLAFIITEGQYYDVSSRLAARDSGPSGLPSDWLAPIVMFAMAIVFQILMTKFQWGRSVFSIGGNETAALFSGIAIGRVKSSVYLVGACSRRSRASCW